MDTFFELLLDNESAAGRAVSSVAVVAFGFVLASFLPSVVTRRSEDATTRYYARKLVRFGIGVVVLVVLAVIWRAFAGRIGVVLGLGAAGLAFAMQEVVGAIAGWFNILSGSIFRVGDRIQMGGVRGDVIDITPLRTKIMEMGTANEDGSWVGGRQYTGRIVAVSNKMTFTEPVFNYSTVFGFIWEELTVPVPYEADWHRAEQILRDEVASVSATPGAQEAITEMAARYPVPLADVEPRVFMRATDNWNELAARFVVPVRSARLVKDGVTRRVLDRFAAEGIPIASATSDVTVHLDQTSAGPASQPCEGLVDGEQAEEGRA